MTTLEKKSVNERNSTGGFYGKENNYILSYLFYKICLLWIGAKLYMDQPVIWDPSTQKLVKDFIPLYRPVRSLVSQSRGSCLTAFSNLKLWGVDAQKTEVSVGLVIELRVVGHEQDLCQGIKERYRQMGRLHIPTSLEFRNR